MTGSVNAATIDAAGQYAECALARLKIDTALSLERRQSDAVGQRSVLTKPAHALGKTDIGLSGTRSGRQAGISKASASESDLN
jgi:hypothetical protein